VLAQRLVDVEQVLSNPDCEGTGRDEIRTAELALSSSTAFSSVRDDVVDAVSSV
jgi:hypothetical protein